MREPSVESGGRPSIAFAAAALSLSAFPLGLVAVALFVSEEHRLDGSVALFLQAHRIALACLAVAALLGSLGSSIVVFEGVRRQSPMSFAVVPISGLVSLVAAAAGALDVAMAKPMCAVSDFDVPFYAFGVFRDGQLISGSGLVWAGLILATSGAGVFVAAAASRTSRVLWVGAALLSSSAFVVFVSTLRLVRLAEVLRDSSNQRAEDFFEVIARKSGALPDTLLAGSTVVLLLVVVIGVAALFRSPRTATLLVLFGASALLPTGTLGIFGASTATPIRSVIPRVDAGFVAIDGTPTGVSAFSLRQSARDPGALLRHLEHQAPFDRDLALSTKTAFVPTTRFGVETTAETADLIRIIETVAPYGPRTLELVGIHKTDVSSAARELRPFLNHLERTFHSVQVRVVPSEPGVDDIILTDSTKLPELLSAAAAANRRGATLTVRLDAP